MNTVVFNTEQGEPFAILLLSAASGPHRDGILVQPPFGSHDSPQAKALLRCGPVAHACRCMNETDGTVVAFEHPDGWRILVNLYSDDEGDWSATLGTHRMFGQAIGLRRWA